MVAVILNKRQSQYFSFTAADFFFFLCPVLQRDLCAGPLICVHQRYLQGENLTVTQYFSLVKISHTKTKQKNWKEEP